MSARLAQLSIGLICVLLIANCAKPYTDKQALESISLANAFTNHLESNTDSTLSMQKDFTESLLTLIDDKTLESLLQIALVNNTNILTITSQIAQAREVLGLANANMLPKLSINMGYNYSSGNYNRYQININQNTLSGNLSLSWELDLFGKLNMLKKSKKYDYLAKLSDLSAAQVSLIGEVASDYYAYTRLRSAAHMQEQIIHNYDKILATLRHKYKLGLVDISAINDTLSTLSTAQSTYSSLQLEQEKMKNALIVLLNLADPQVLVSILDGTPESTQESAQPTHARALDSTTSMSPIDPKAKDSPSPDSALQNLATLPTPRIPALHTMPREILLCRDDIRASIANLNAQIMLKNSKKAALFPALNLGGSLGQILFSSHGVGDLIWNITSSLASPLINRSALTKDYKIQKESVKQAFYALESTLRTAIGEIENAITEVNTASSSLQARETMLQSAQEIWLIAQAQYQLGLIDEAAYLTSHNTFLGASSSADEARLARLSSVIVLYKALGGKLAIQESTNDNHIEEQSHAPESIQRG